MATQNEPMGVEALSRRREMTLVRVLDAPRALVFEAWTNPKHVARWWGPDGFTNPVCEMDVRVGGKINILMRGLGMEHSMIGTFSEVAPPERLVFTAIATDAAGAPMLESLTTITFAEGEGAKTRLTVHASAVGLAPPSVQMLAGMEMGWSQSLARLADVTAELARG